MMEPATTPSRPLAPGELLAAALAVSVVVCPLLLIVGPVTVRWANRRASQLGHVTAACAGAALVSTVLGVATSWAYFASLASFWPSLLAGSFGASALALGQMTPVGVPSSVAIGLLGRLGLQAVRERHPTKGRGARDERQNRTLDARAKAARRSADRIPLLDCHGRPVLGAWLEGNQPPGWRDGRLLSLPDDVSHLVALGATGGGKSETILRLVASHLAMGWRVIVLDAKEDDATRQQFLGIARRSAVAAVRVTTWPEAGPIDLMRGSPAAIRDRWMAAESYTEPFYRGVAATVLTLVTDDPEGPPQRPRDLLRRFDHKALVSKWTAHPNGAAARVLTADQVAGTSLRYFAKVADLEACGATPVGTETGWSWEDTDACWVTLPTATRPETAAMLGRVLLLDLMSYLRDRDRRPDDRRILLVVEEMGALTAADPDTASAVIEGVERARSAGVRCILSAQTIEGLGRPDAQARLLHGGPAVLAHRMPAPEPVVSLLGTRYGMEASIGVDGFGDLGDQGSLREQHQWQVAPDRLRRLPVGRALLIHAGLWAEVAVAAIRAPKEPEALIPHRPRHEFTPPWAEMDAGPQGPAPAQDWTDEVWEVLDLEAPASTVERVPDLIATHPMARDLRARLVVNARRHRALAMNATERFQKLEHNAAAAQAEQAVEAIDDPGWRMSARAVEQRLAYLDRHQPLQR